MEAARPASPMPDAARAASVEHWRRRLLRTLLYGRDIDRTVKARARIALVVLIFALGYSAIAARLVIFAVAGEVPAGRRAAGPDALATARPEILDRNGEILAIDVRTPSMFGEPHRIIDADEASELLTAVMTDADA